MPKPKGMISPMRAAKMLGIHFNTMYAWCKKVERGEPSELSVVVRDEDNGYLYISLDEVLALRTTRNKP